MNDNAHPTDYTDKPEAMTEAELVLWNLGLDYARNVFTEEGCVHAAMFSVNDANEIGYSPMVGMTKAESSLLIGQIKQLAPVVTIVEAWMITTTKEKNPEMMKAAHAGDPIVSIPPSEHPDRKEVVCVNFYHKERRVQASAAIVRKDGKATLGPWRVFDSAKDGNVLRGMDFGNRDHRHV